MYQEDILIKSFEIKNTMKSNLSEIAKTVSSVKLMESLVSKYGYIAAITS